MKHIGQLSLRGRSLGRLLAAVLIAGSLVLTGGLHHPRPVSADPSFLPPQILSVRLELPDTAYVTFRETNDAGADVSSFGPIYSFVGQPHPNNGTAVFSNNVPAAGNGRTHTVTLSGLQANTLYCFVGTTQNFEGDPGSAQRFEPSAIWATVWDSLGGGAGTSNEICADMSQAGTAESPLPCGISGIKVTGADTPIRSYDYTYYCDGSFSFHVSALFDTRPLSSDPSDANNHRAFEKLTDGSTQIIVNWSCPTDPWGLANTQTCTPRGDPAVQNPKASFPVQNGPLPLSVRFLSDTDRQELADSLVQALTASSGTNRPLTALAAGTAPATGSTSSATLPKAPAAPADFAGARDNGLGLTIVLTWSAVSGADYYYLTASSHNGNNPVALGHGAPQLDKSTTMFTVGSGDNAANIQGGVDFKLQTCNAGGCSRQVTVTVQ